MTSLSDIETEIKSKISVGNKCYHALRPILKRSISQSIKIDIFLHTKHIGPRCRTPDRQPTTTTGHHTTCCNLQSYAPDDGQVFVRNMLS
jgi:hypothetical protein